VIPICVTVVDVDGVFMAVVMVSRHRSGGGHCLLI
jgi:hypothetical protein